MTKQEKQALADIAYRNKNTKEGQRLAKIITAEKVQTDKIKNIKKIYFAVKKINEILPLNLDPKHTILNDQDAANLKNLASAILKEIS